jgi:hypothetical protein
VLTNSKIEFRDSDIYIASLNDGYLDIEADTALRIGIGVEIDDNINEVQHITPQTAGTYNLGSPTKEWSQFYIANAIYFGASQGANLYESGDDLKTDDTFVCAKINTGHGDNEVYAMNQDVETTDNVTFNSVQGAHKSSDGTAGTNTSFDVCTDCSGTIVTVTVKDGLITSVT